MIHDKALWERLRAHAERALITNDVGTATGGVPKYNGSVPSPAHDFSHVLRVVRNAAAVAEGERARHQEAPLDETRLAIAALLHELVNLPKNHPDSSKSGDLCAEHAFALLLSEGVSHEDANAIAEMIRDHAFSKGATPTSTEGCILQDADRLDAIGAIGIARCFATTAEMKRPFYSPSDPFCASREPNDKEWGLDHFYKKLLKLQSGFHTETARNIARDRTAFLNTFLLQLEGEIGP